MGEGRRTPRRPVCACAYPSVVPACWPAHARWALGRGRRLQCACAPRGPLRNRAGGRRTARDVASCALKCGPGRAGRLERWLGVGRGLYSGPPRHEERSVPLCRGTRRRRRPSGGRLARRPDPPLGPAWGPGADARFPRGVPARPESHVRPPRRSLEQRRGPWRPPAATRTCARSSSP